jgi:tricarballylate dehydrogenase
MQPIAMEPGGAAPTMWDILVIGGGLAGLCAAIAARKRGATVRLVENAPFALRGGNARHARNFRAAHGAPTWYSPGVYTADEFMAELTRVTGDDLDGALAHSLIGDTINLASWLMDCGVRLQDPRVGVVPFSRRTAFLLGGGKAMLNALYETAARIGVVVAYGSEAVALTPRSDEAWSVEVVGAEKERIAARCVVVAAGGAGADPQWLRAHFGPAADCYSIRGGSHSNGRAMHVLINAGVRTVGDPATCHTVAVDARGPRFDGGIVTRITAIPHGVVVDRHAARAEIAGRDAGRTHYARWGPRIADCPDGVAFLILDSDGLSRAHPTALPPISAGTIGALAGALDLDAEALGRAVDSFNVERPLRRRPIATPPFFAFPMRPGLTFVHYGLAVDDQMRVSMRDGRTVETLFAAGMIMAANVLGRGYLAGLGLTLSAVSGRRAGEAAARHVFR